MNAKDYLPLEVFCELHNIKYSRALSFFLRNNEFYVKVRGDIFVNNKAIVEAYEKKKRFINLAHNIYYCLVEIFQSEYRLSKRLSLYGTRTTQAWNNYITSRLWVADDNILNYKISPTLLEFIMRGARLLYLYKNHQQGGSYIQERRLNEIIQ